ncbi:MAG: FKBP-type peptidyl-prolyl cis-trans isomerase [Phycisphaerae bacterium]|nr:FKBP-type peptidyl-prolyl cis-trans isomerase [Phycisphaerae bacterium]
MKLASILFTVVGLALAATGVEAERTAAGPELSKQIQKVSYAIGRNIGQNLRRDDLGLDSDLVIRGLADALKDNPSLLTEEQIATAMAGFRKQMAAKQARRQIDGDPKLKALAEKNLADAGVFLAANGQKEGIRQTKSGLQYRIVEAGTGPSPKRSDRVKTHYRGTLLNGAEFDSSHKRGQPAVFAVGEVVPGWVEALQMMKVGAKWQLFLPPDLGYGLSPQGPGGPNALLIFDIQLLQIMPAEEPNQP